MTIPKTEQSILCSSSDKEAAPHLQWPEESPTEIVDLEHGKEETSAQIRDVGSAHRNLERQNW